MSAQETVDPSTIAEMEETIARISSHKGVEGVMIMDRRGAIIQSTLDDDQAKTHAAALSDLTGKASYIVGMLNQDDELTFLRIRSKEREIMISPDKEFLLVVLQNPNLSE
mmetsp:Transcript_39957/g.83921  ORF Transcript_39957/g.83921 Transcript_39957/m.83921 type:complete len:110 (-) Transcript_39957:263-592(-)|eukprot:CAMPEP_0183714068 /NCGR_PEP_ID=MMETSP0737-20130205/8750_1 /TAXON_ID=385413 /ORGANISM="Thalassiosira miniscula, Strain CCMP1093" /LENGTH=109 /DNA_ID=CAMNT_0025942973 /DNA_START=29 /DNA_END=358 /DNA_ORIENTATION=-